MKSILSVLAVFSLLAAAGCVAGNRASGRASVKVQRSPAALLHSPASVEKKVESNLALANVLARAQSAAFREAVAESLGVSLETMGTVTVWGLPQTGVLEVKAELSDSALAAKLANAVAQRLAEDYRANPDIHVTVIRLARVPMTSEGME